MSYERHQSSHKPTIVLAADRVRARLFESSEDDQELTEFETLVHPQSRQLSQELVSDAPALNAGAGYPKSSAMQASSPHELEAEKFAHEIARCLDGLRRHDRLGRLYLLAEPRFLGLLRGALDDATRNLVTGEVHRHMTDVSAQELRAALPSKLH